jgi:hypothetical protein
MTLKEIADWFRKENPKASMVKLTIWYDTCKLKIISEAEMKALDGSYVDEEVKDDVK